MIGNWIHTGIWCFRCSLQRGQRCSTVFYRKVLLRTKMKKCLGSRLGNAGNECLDQKKLTITSTSQIKIEILRFGRGCSISPAEQCLLLPQRERRQRAALDRPPYIRPTRYKELIHLQLLGKPMVATAEFQ